MSVEGAVFTAFNTLLTSMVANPAAAAGKVEAVVRQHSSSGDTVPYPHLFVEVVSDQHHEAFDNPHYSVQVRVHTFYNRDQDGSQGALDAIQTTQRAALSNVTPSPTLAWGFSKIVRLRGFRGPSTEHHGHRIEEYALIVTALSGGDG